MKVVMEFEGVLDVIFIEENEIPCRTNSANAVRPTNRKIFGDERGGRRPQKYRLEFVHSKWLVILRAWLWSSSTGVVDLAFGCPLRVLVRAAVSL